MSYRSVKRILGETNLERKCRLLFGACLLTLIMGSFWWYSSETNKLVLDSTRETARGLAGTILYRNHAKWLANKTEPHYAELYQNLGEVLADQEYDWKFLSPNRDLASQKLDKVEEEILNYFNNEPDPALDFREQRDDKKYKYFLAVRTKDSCIICHISEGLYTQAVLQPGDLEAVMEVILPDEKTKEALSWNIAILLACGIVTVFLAMIASWAIVRYIIVKPLKHLRNVSDEISRGNVALRADIHTGDEFEELGVAFNRMLRHLIDHSGRTAPCQHES